MHPSLPKYSVFDKLLNSMPSYSLELAATSPTLTQWLKSAAVVVLSIALLVVWRKWRRSRQESQKEAVEQNKVLLQSILHGLGDACFIATRQGEITYANEGLQTLLGLPYSLEGKRLSQILPDTTITKFINGIFDSPHTTDREAFNTALHPTGRKEEHYLIVDVARVHVPGSEQTHARVIIQDETRRFETEQIRKDFVANASHELRTPLAIINGYLENLLEGMIATPEHQHRALTVMKKHGDRIARLVEDMLTVSKFDAAGEENPDLLRTQSFKLLECVESVLDRLSPMFEAKRARHHVALEPELLLAGERLYWDQIFFNLIENALKENRDDGRLIIDIEAVRAETGLVVRVRDNGIGIPHEHLPFVFKRFYRVAKDHSQSRVKGTGLGLSIVSRAVQAHGGTIRVESSPGLRTEFIIDLPDVGVTQEAANEGLPAVGK
jgi:two-component system, OmpR family, phosphate regulon sensor histidine kinase PhoR